MDPVEPSLRADLNEIIDQSTFKEVLSGFCDILGFPVRLFDDQGALLIESAKTNRVCQYLRTFGETSKRCTVVRSQVKTSILPKPKNGTEFISCFSGFKYAIAPLVFQASTVGKIVAGPYFPADLHSIPCEIIQIEPSIDTAKLKESFLKVSRISDETIVHFVATIRITLEALLFSSHKALVTNKMHLATVRESYRELTEKNRRLEEMNEERKEFDRRKSNFLAMVSHELRTPLTSIIGYSDMLSEGIAGQLAAEQQQFVKTIKAKGDELLKLISSILDFSLIDSGRLTLQITPANVKSVVNEAIKLNLETANRRGVKLSIDIASGLPAVSLDIEKIVTSISHLLDNAIKFSNPDGLVKVSAHVVSSNESDSSEDGYGFVLMAAPDMLEIAVEDFGDGISDHEYINIFAPFTQIDESSTREHGGAGLGLVIVKDYVEAHGGRVTVKSFVDKGSTFAMRIPIVNQNS